MIICPRCGFQAPDGSPWCPRCGYGCPYPVPYQQPPQRMTVPYQPQPDPAQYEVVDIPPQPDPEPPKPEQPKKKKKKLHGCLLALVIFLGVVVVGALALFTGIFIHAVKTTSTLAKTQTVEAVLSATATATDTLTPTITPTETPLPSATPRPTRTPVPTRTPLPAHCNIKGNVNNKGEKIYHCLNSPSYKDVNVNEYEGDRWFCSPEEAEAAGFRAPRNLGRCQQ